MEDGDSVIFLNFRSDRARQLSRPFIEPDFSEFEREVTPRLATYCTLTGYSDDFVVSVAFPPERIKNGLGEYVANLGLRQLRIAETEKYPHVTFFFNGGEETSFPGEDRVLVPSPDVATYDLKPEMSAYEVTDKLVAAIEQQAIRRHHLQLRQRRTWLGTPATCRRRSRRSRRLMSVLARWLRHSARAAARCW